MRSLFEEVDPQGLPAVRLHYMRDKLLVKILSKKKALQKI